MAYATYITEALVCGTRVRNTSDCSYLLFTKNAGMLFADARSTREEKSKQRFALQDFSYVRVSLIKGKSGWRIGSVESLKNYYASAEDKAARGSVVSMVRMLRRFIQGEESMQSVFDYALESLEVLSVQQEKRAYIENVIQLRFLQQLGYVAERELPQDIKAVQPEGIVSSYSDQVDARVKLLLKRSVSSSHL